MRQARSLSLALFNYATDWSMSHAVMGYPGVQLKLSVCVTDLELVVDVVALGDSQAAMQVKLDRTTLSNGS